MADIDIGAVEAASCGFAHLLDEIAIAFRANILEKLHVPARVVSW